MGSGAAKARGKKASMRQKAAKAASSSASTPRNKKSSPYEEQLSLRQWQQFAMNSPGASHSPKGFSLAEEARNTGHQGSGWRSNNRLRDQGIRFVAAGVLNQRPEATEDEDSPVDDGGDLDTMKNADTLPGNRIESEPPPVAQVSPALQDAEHSGITEQVQAMNLKGAERALSPDVDIPYAQSVTRPSSSASSASSTEDVIVFAGRGANKSTAKSVSATKSQPTAQPRRASPSSRSTRPPLNSFLSSNSAGSWHSSRPFEVIASHTAINDIVTQSMLGTSSSDDVNARPEVKSRISGKKRKSGRMTYADLMADMADEQVSDEDDALVKDYMENMRDFSDSDESESDAVKQPVQAQGMDGLLDASIPPAATVTMAAKEPVMVETAADGDPYGDWDSADLEDLNDMSTSEECPEEISKILACRDRDSGLQYLVIGQNEPVDEARWITQEVLSSRDAIDVLRVFEARQEAMLAEFEALASEEDDDASSEDSDEAAFNDYLENLESEQDEMDEVKRRQAHMTDEQIAAALAKQEELGMTADEVLLFDGMIDDDVLNGFTSARQSKSNYNTPSGRSGKKSRRSDQFPSAEAFADALDQDPYGAFDIMDFDRPSLKPKKKGRKSALPFEIDDEELQMQLEQSWENDRRKKGEKKREREALRAAGLLGSKNGRADMSMKYKNGMSTHHVRLEVKAFLQTSDETLSLVPMDNLQRRQVHLIAHALKLKSRSQGQGASRYPVLTKTKFTPVFDIDFSETELDEILNSAHNPGQMYKAARKGGKGAFAKVKTTGGASGRVKRGGGGGGAASGVKYMDGDVVGASAPEIGVGNKGRALLEKMGWVQGMGIGAIGNKGIVVPVQHVVKNTKAGLG